MKPRSHRRDHPALHRLSVFLEAALLSGREFANERRPQPQDVLQPADVEHMLWTLEVFTDIVRAGLRADPIPAARLLARQPLPRSPEHPRSMS